MTKIEQTKRLLLQGTGAALAISMSLAQAQAADNVTVDSTITVTGIDGIMPSDQNNADSNPDDATDIKATATLTDETIITPITSAEDSSSVVENNTVSARALGNTDTLTFTDADAALNSTTAAVVARQENSTFDITAEVSSTDLGQSTTSTVDGSSLRTTDNTDSANATGNIINQIMTVDSTKLTLSTETASADTNGSLGAEGAAVVASKQLNTDSEIAATNTDSQVFLTAGGTSTNGNLELSGNAQSTSAAGSSSANGLTLTGTDIGSGAAIVSQQTNDSTSSVSSTVDNAEASLVTDSLSDTAADLSDNRQLAQASGVSGSNSLSVSGTTLTMTSAGAASANSDTNLATAGYVTVNDQLVQGAVSATTSGSSATIEPSVASGTAVSNSNLTLDNNLQAAVASGATIANSTALSGTDVQATAAVLNMQAASGGVTATASTDSVGIVTTGPITGSSSTVSANRQLSQASGVSATNALSVSGTLIDQSTSGSASSNSTDNSVGAAYTSLNDQLVSGAVSASTTGSSLTNSVSSTVTNSSVDLLSNIQSASATGGSASTSVTLDGTTVTSNAALLSQQQTTDTVTATTGTYIDPDTDEETVLVSKIQTGTLSDSSATLSANRQLSSATGLTATNSISATGTTLAQDSAVLATADGGATDRVSSAYANLNDQKVAGKVEAATGSSLEVTLGSNSATNSQINLTANTQSATGTGAAATNGVTLTGNDVTSNAAILNLQETTSAGVVNVDATVGAKIVTGALEYSSASLTGNTQQALATGVTAANTLTTNATNLTLAAPDTIAAVTVNDSGSVSASLANLNQQTVSGIVSADTTTATDTSAFAVSASSGTNSTVSNSSNTIQAKAQGALATNATTLNVASTLQTDALDPDTDPDTDNDVANVAAVGNVQTVTDAANVTAGIKTADTDYNTISTTFSGSLLGSSVATSSNKLAATAEGANATNSLTVEAAKILVDSGATGEATVGTAGTGVAAANSAFSVANVQTSGDNDVTASDGNLASVFTQVIGTVTNSNVASNGNGIDAFATSNKAANSLTLTGTNVTADAGALNVQSSSSDVSALIGSTVTTAGVVAEFEQAISGSSVTVDGNVLRGSAVSNSATTTLTVSATQLDGTGADAIQAFVDTDAADADEATVTATADFALASQQTLTTGASSTTAIYSEFGIDQAFDKAVTDTMLSVSNNVQFGEALGNTATNRISLSAADTGAGVTPTAALSSMQDGYSANISATSAMTVYTNAAADGSSVAMNGNANTALGVVNNASNTLVATATNLSADATNLASINLTAGEAYADYALNNAQSASGTLSSTASTSVFNLDSTDLLAPAGTLGLVDSSASISKNVTTAEASANRVSNQVALSGSASIGATAALNNGQTSSTAVTATASSANGFSLTANAQDLTPEEEVYTYAASGSALNMDGNTTTALARGNTANNTMTYVAGASYVAPTSEASLPAIGSLEATAALFNNQSNSGSVQAISSNTSYSIALNLGTGTGAMLNSSTSMANNAVSAVAYGNSAVNNLTMQTFGAGVPSAAAYNSQLNTGSISATANTVNYGVGITGPLTSGSVRNTGNTVTAQAIGNSSVSTISGGM